MNDRKTFGKVVIAGAGPGDPELITLKALRHIETADVIIVDRLVSEVLLANAKPSAKIIFAGKQGRNGGSACQQQINELIVQNAREYDVVLRLKGGDVSIFSNLLDEIDTLNSLGISYEIVPGITAASGASAYAGIPLTARGYSTAVRFLTCYNPELIEEKTWKDWATTDDTLVLYMSGNSLDHIVGKLLDNDISADKHLAVIGQATTPQQHVEVYNLYEYELSGAKQKPASPSLIIIGKVAQLHKEFAWLPNANGQDYFRPIEKEAITTISSLTHH